MNRPAWFTLGGVVVLVGGIILALPMASPPAGAAQTGDGVGALLEALIAAHPDSLSQAFAEVLADCDDGDAEACSSATLLVDQLNDADTPSR
jgi:hypothetical protein